MVCMDFGLPREESHTWARQIRFSVKVSPSIIHKGWPQQLDSVTDMALLIQNRLKGTTSFAETVNQDVHRSSVIGPMSRTLSGCTTLFKALIDGQVRF